MLNLTLLNSLRDLAKAWHGAEEIEERIIDSLEELQERIDDRYAHYEDQTPPTGAEALRDLMLEALRLIHDGLEEFLIFAEDFTDKRLSLGVAMVEEGHDLMESVLDAIGQDLNWTSGASLS